MASFAPSTAGQFRVCAPQTSGGPVFGTLSLPRCESGGAVRALFLGHSKMFARTAFVAAGRAIAYAPPLVLVDLNLTSPDWPRPVAFEEDVNGGPAHSPDLSVTAPPLPQEPLTPASALSPNQEVFRRELFSTLQLAFASSAATGTVRTYGATLRVIVPGVAMKLGTQVLPTSSVSQVYSFFGSVSMLGPKSPSPVSAQPGVR